MNKITINGKEFEIKNLKVSEWLELAKAYDEMKNADETNVGYVVARCKIVAILFGLTDEEIQSLSADYIIPLYLKGAEGFQSWLSSKMGDEKKSETENPTIEN